MLFSIIVPVYNVGKYVEECIKSIEAQTNRDFELIIVQDKTSSDNSEEIVLAFQERYENIYVVYQDHKGLGAARNYGMTFAKGEYLIFLDSDDCMGEDDYLDEIAKVVNKKTPDYVITRSKKCVGANKTGKEVGKPWGRDITENPVSRNALIKVLDSGYFVIAAWAKAVRREFCINNRLQFVDGFCEDYAWTSKIINLTDRYAFINNAGITHYTRAGSLSGAHSYRQVADLGKRILEWKDMISDDTVFGRAQLGYLAYSYYIFAADIHFVDKKEQIRLWEIEKEISFLRKYGVSKKCKYSELLCRILGIKIGSYILHQYIKKESRSIRVVEMK